MNVIRIHLTHQVKWAFIEHCLRVLLFPLGKRRVANHAKFFPNSDLGMFCCIHTKTIDSIIRHIITEPFHDVKTGCSRISRTLKKGIELGHFLIQTALFLPLGHELRGQSNFLVAFGEYIRKILY